MKITDGDWTLVDYDPATGRSVWHWFDGQANHFRTDYPVAGLLEANKAHLNESQGRRFGGGRRVASVPLNLFYEQLAKAQIQSDRKYMKKWLNDGDNRAFRTFEGHL